MLHPEGWAPLTWMPFLWAQSVGLLSSIIHHERMVVSPPTFLQVLGVGVLAARCGPRGGASTALTNYFLAGDC